ncbi:MAG: GntR family transcriptional regulator [Acidothermus cellulolyticus]|nr:GntR family transcriptional regulator [Acidothermus cellulolyticus]MCL6549757.1 GntR family transcriptional regulator [Acidothermus cellulolyticus]
MTDLSLTLDRSSPVPLYYQIAQQIEQAIERGELAPGTKLDNEIELADRLGLSRPTMRRAIQELVRKGLLVRKRGVGTQVVHGKVKRPVELTSLYDDLLKSNQKPRTDVLTLETIPAADEVAVHLGIEPRSQVIYVERVRYARDEPLAIMHNWLPAHLVSLERSDLERAGLYDRLRKAGIRICVASQRIGAKAATSEEARLLRTRRGAPLLTMARVAYDDTGRAVEYGSHVYRSDSYTFEITLVERQ